jgi:hypothetical protein
MGALPQVLEIIFEVQRKMNNEKITRREINFPTYKFYLFIYFLFEPLLLSNLITFLYLIHLKWFRVLYERHLKFYKLSLNYNNNKSTYKESCGCLGTGLCNIWWFTFWVFDPSILKGHNFINSIPSLIIFSALDMPIRGVQVLFKH